MRLIINYAGVRAAGTDAQKRTALYGQLKAALMLLPLALASVSASEAVKASVHSDSRISGGDFRGLTEERAKSFLQSDRAATIMGAKWATAGDNPILQQTTSNMVQFFADNVQEMDLGYLALFEEVPGMLGSDQDHFELLGASMGFTWDQRKPGAIIKPRREVTENKVVVPYLTFSDGFSFLDDWFRFSKYYHIAEVSNEFVSTYYNKKAELHYGLITGQGAGIDIAFTVDDATTFNTAVADILRKGEKKFALGANVQVDIVVSPEKVGRVLAFLDAQRGSPMIAFGSQKQPIAYSVRNIIVTTKVAAADTGYYVVLPGRKLKRAEWTPLTVESKREPAASAEDWYGKGQYNAIAGDSDQIRRVKYG